jgi:hypothetical protein
MLLAVLSPDFLNSSSPCPTNSILILSAFISCNLDPCVWGYKDGELTRLDPYTDDNYHLVVSVGEDGSLQHCNLSTKIIAWITSFYSDCVNA